MTEFSQLDPSIRDAALRGLRDADKDLGIPTNSQEVLDDVESGKKVKKLLGQAALTQSHQPTSNVSERALNAPGGRDHAELGPLPEDLIR